MQSTLRALLLLLPFLATTARANQMVAFQVYTTRVPIASATELEFVLPPSPTPDVFGSVENDICFEFDPVSVNTMGRRSRYWRLGTSI